MQHPHSHDSSFDGLSGTHTRRASLMQRIGLAVLVVFLVALVASMAIVFYAAHSTTPGGSASPKSPQAPQAPQSAQAPRAAATQASAHVALKVTSVSMAVTPKSIAGIFCGTRVTVTYTATFHTNTNNAGGTVHFLYTVNNGRGSTPASISFNAGQTSKSYAFTWSGALPFDHTYPGPGGVQVTSPNQLTSPMVKPAGQCAAAKFQVTSIDMAVSPISIQGIKCGTYIVVTYTATIHVAAHSSGGTVQFFYTVNNGRGSTPASVGFYPGQTTATFSFTWRGNLPPDHTYPEPGGIQVTSPNQLTSALVAPTGRCA